MAIPFPTLDWILERRTKAPTPGILKAAIIVQGFFVMGQTRPAGTITGGTQALMYFGLWAVEAAILVALWKMKRWPVVILAAYALVHAVTAMPHYFATTPRSVPEALFFAAIILVFHPNRPPSSSESGISATACSGSRHRAAVLRAIPHYVGLLSPASFAFARGRPAAKS